MYALFLGVGVGACEFLVDKLRGVERLPTQYLRDMGLVFLAMTLLKLLERM